MENKKLVFRTNIDIIVDCPDMDTSCEIMKVVNAAANKAIEDFESCTRNSEHEYSSISIRRVGTQVEVASVED